jgi:tetratricopeptide (TPR) repeat protein
MKLSCIDHPDVDICEFVSDWLNTEDSGQWLMVLDNADNSELFFRTFEASNQETMTKKPLIDYLPRKLNSNRSLIVTTRNRQLGEDLSSGEPCIEIPPFAVQEARDLLRSKAGKIADNWNNSDTDALAEVLGHIPLAITQAAAFMRRNRMSLQKYLNALERNEQNLKDYLNTELRGHGRESDTSNCVFRTWEMSYDQVRTQEPRAAAMLCLMAMLDGHQIPEKLLRRSHERDIDFSTAIGILDSLSLVMKVGQRTFAIHRLVQLSIHVWLEQHNEKEGYEEEALSLLADRFPNGEQENWELCESLFPHAQAVLRYDPVTKSSMIQRADLLYNISWFDLRQGRYGSAYEKISESYQLNGKLQGRKHIQTLRSLTLLAIVLQHQGKYEDSEEMHKRALKEQEEVLGMEHRDTLTSVNNLAEVLRNQGKYEKSEKMHRRALEGKEKALGVEHPNTLTSVDNLALVLRDQGKYEEAEEMHRRTLKEKEKVLGVEHPSTLTSVNNLALVLQDQGKYEEAEEMHRRALKRKEKVLGVKHPDTLISVNNLASVLQGQGKYKEAEEMHQRALEESEKILGVEHPDTSQCQQSGIGASISGKI